MNDHVFNVDAWLSRIGHAGSREPTLATLRALIAAHSAAIPFESIDVLLGRTPQLDLGSLQQKMIEGGRGGYCFEQNALFSAGLTALGFRVTGLIARVIRGMPPDAAGSATHMALRVDLPEGPYLADVGFGNQTPTAPLAIRPHLEQETPHELMRLLPVGGEFTLQAKLGVEWISIYRLSPDPRLPIDYEVANWFTATHPRSPFVSNLIVARPGPNGVRNTLFNGRLNIRRPGNEVERSEPAGEDGLKETLHKTFGLKLSDADLTAALAALDRHGNRGVGHPFFA